MRGSVYMKLAILVSVHAPEVRQGIGGAGPAGYEVEANGFVGPATYAEFPKLLLAPADPCPFPCSVVSNHSKTR
jgi:hypothetical protein